jgi:hypothetical protein
MKVRFDRACSAVREILERQDSGEIAINHHCADTVVAPQRRATHSLCEIDEIKFPVT